MKKLIAVLPLLLLQGCLYPGYGGYGGYSNGAWSNYDPTYDWGYSGYDRPYNAGAYQVPRYQAPVYQAPAVYPAPVYQAAPAPIYPAPTAPAYDAPSYQTPSTYHSGRSDPSYSSGPAYGADPSYGPNGPSIAPATGGYGYGYGGYAPDYYSTWYGAPGY
ncbi:MAG TPA: hypothetical protein VG821_09925 [Rhizomicrobium sp.]|jgi:hypothetical protein|nr:hypothetical protein [Rhizomicrobium sp.]